MSLGNYGFEYDRFYYLPVLRWIQYVYGSFMVLIVHPTFFYLLIKKSRGFHPAIRRGYIVNQVNMVIHDISNNLAYQMYIPAPYPAVYCYGLPCQVLPTRGFELMIMQCLIMAHGIPPYYYMILNTTQQILPHSSVFKISQRTMWLLLFLVYVTLCLNVLYFCVGHSLQRPELFDKVGLEILLSHISFDKIEELSWLKSFPGGIAIIGRVGELEELNSYYPLFVISAILLTSFMGGIVFHAFYTLIAYRNSSKSRAHILQIRFIRILLIQTSLVIIFYGIPIATLLGMIKFYHFPGWILAIARCLSLLMFSVNSIVECIILLIMTPKYQKIIKDKILTSFDFKKPVQQIDISVTTKI